MSKEQYPDKEAVEWMNAPLGPEAERPFSPSSLLARDAYEALSWALDIMDMSDERLAKFDGNQKVYTQMHLAGKAKARATLETLKRANATMSTPMH